MTDSEGVIQYRLVHGDGDLPRDADYQGLFDWFARCRQQDLLGRDPQRYGGYAYGNISVRVGNLRAADGFVISGTQTGGKVRLERDDLAWVRRFDSAANTLTAQGPAKPSSEAMTHGEVYAELPAVGAVIHAHSPAIWDKAAELGLPVTDAGATYGTPAMASEVRRLLQTMPQAGVITMGGHEDGVIAYAATMSGAGERLLDTLARARAS
jgi:hypothetical protein